jgi:heme/copper-type cytochrome/quinol oxidase subunit 1
MAQGAWIAIPPNTFDQIMTAHGAGMVVTVGLAVVAGAEEVFGTARYG